MCKKCGESVFNSKFSKFAKKIKQQIPIKTNFFAKFIVS